MEEYHCPVCGMNAETSTIHARHLDIEYHFCSPQCKENFTARPQLYFGRTAPKRHGRQMIKCRSFTLDQCVEDRDRERLQHAILHLMGIRDVQVEGQIITITYDLLEATATQVEQTLTDAGAVLGSGWSERLKRGWIHYTEENELDNLATGDAACCNKPPAKG